MPCCCFDASEYTGVPDTAPCPVSLDVPEIISRLDGLYNSGREAEAESFLETQREKAVQVGDWRGELSILSELLGQYRRSMKCDRAADAIDSALDIIKEHHMGSTVSGATVLLNAATTLKCFGRSSEAVPIFRHVSRVFSDKLDPTDYRFAGLYNNMALACADVGDISGAERLFALAMNIMKKQKNGENELAVTLCNMAEMYDRLDAEDERIGQCLERAWEYLNTPGLPRDGYHAFTASKCAPAFDRLGFFLYAAELYGRARKIYDGT